MSNDLSIRIGDAERDAAARELSEHYAAGRLDSDEFESRLELANRAKTRGQIDALMRDLPGRQRRSGRSHVAHAWPLVPTIAVVALVGVLLSISIGRGGPPFFLIPIIWFLVIRPLRRGRWMSA